MEEQTRQIIRSLAEMAWADGEVSPEERSLLVRVLTEAGADPGEIETLGDLLSRPSDNIMGEAASLEHANLDEEGRLNVMRALMIMSFMDGVLSFAEYAQIERVSKELQISPEQMELLRAEAIEAAKQLNPNAPA